MRARRKVAVTVLAFVVIFGLCFLPSHLFMLWFYYRYVRDQRPFARLDLRQFVKEFHVAPTQNVRRTDEGRSVDALKSIHPPTENINYSPDVGNFSLQDAIAGRAVILSPGHTMRGCRMGDGERRPRSVWEGTARGFIGGNEIDHEHNPLRIKN